MIGEARARARRVASQGYRYLLQLGRDARHGGGVAQMGENTLRFLRRFQPDAVASAPPHPIQRYRVLLERLLNSGQCTFRPLIDHVQGAPIDHSRLNVMLRHDLDAGEPGPARALCNVERALGLRSSVHILVDGTVYDPSRVADLARELQADGFDVGLHTQAWMRADYVEAFAEEVRRFEALFGFGPRTFTQHGAWPRTDADLARRDEFTRRTPNLIRGTTLLGYNNDFDWVSEDSNVRGQPAPLRRRFFRIGEQAYLGSVALILTHDNHWRPG